MAERNRRRDKRHSPNFNFNASLLAGKASIGSTDRGIAAVNEDGFELGPHIVVDPVRASEVTARLTAEIPDAKAMANEHTGEPSIGDISKASSRVFAEIEHRRTLRPKRSVNCDSGNRS